MTLSPATPLLAYVRLRLRLLGRLLREVGWLRLALLLPLLLLALLQALVVLGQHPLGCWLVPLLVAGSLLSAHRQRADAQFLALAAPQHRTWLVSEYVCLSLPVTLGLLALRAGGPAALTPALAALVAWAPPTRAGQPTQHRWRSLFRSEAFEWVGGMRATKGLLVWPVLLALAIWQRASALAPIGGLVAWLLVVAACYGTPEPLAMLALATRSPAQFLRRRLVLGLGYAAGTAAPFWLLLGVGPAGASAAVAVALFWLVLVTLVVLAKYAFYPNATHIRTTQSLLLALALLGAAHPAYPPLLLTALGGLVWQSRRRLRVVIGASESTEQHAGNS